MARPGLAASMNGHGRAHDRRRTTPRTRSARGAPRCCRTPTSSAARRAAPRSRPRTEHVVPGLTAIDAEALIRAKTPSRQRSRLLSWISGEYARGRPISPADAGADRAARPDGAPRDAEPRARGRIANLQAEADAIQPTPRSRAARSTCRRGRDRRDRRRGAEAALDAMPPDRRSDAAAAAADDAPSGRRRGRDRRRGRPTTADAAADDRRRRRRDRRRRPTEGEPPA